MRRKKETKKRRGRDRKRKKREKKREERKEKKKGKKYNENNTKRKKRKGERERETEREREKERKREEKQGKQHSKDTHKRQDPQRNQKRSIFKTLRDGNKIVTTEFARHSLQPSKPKVIHPIRNCKNLGNLDVNVARMASTVGSSAPTLAKAVQETEIRSINLTY